MSIETLSAAFIIGLLGAGHCIGMCGGIGAALTFAIQKDQHRKRLILIFAYNTGRIASYVFMGGLAASMLSLLPKFAFPMLRMTTGILLILMGLYLANIWRVLTYLERGGQIFWRYLQPIGKNLLPVKSFSHALALGALWGWLPCGLVYTALAFAATQANVISGALAMLAFGLGTLPAVVSGGLAADTLKTILQGQWFRRVMAVCMIVFGAWTIWGASQHSHHAHHQNVDSIDQNSDTVDHSAHEHH